VERENNGGNSRKRRSREKVQGLSMNSSDRTPEVQQEADLGLTEALANAKKLAWRLDFD
jgi:hypothetical protein